MTAAPMAAASTSGAQRKRGAALEEAILAAAYEELSAVGYAQFSVEGVAVRARTGKASIYRRWPTKQELVLDALCAALPTPEACGIAADLPDDVTTFDALRRIGGIIAGLMHSPAGNAMRAIKCEAFSDPELARAVDDRFQAPRRAELLRLLQRGVERGEVRPEAVTQEVADVLPAMIAHRVILLREDITETDLAAIIDDVVIPLVAAR
jgi:AcrR family transcriptional regulator